MIKWPNRAGVAIRKLFEPLQEIDVYIEDTNDEAFYCSLLKNATNNEVKVERVFALNGRDNVIEAARNHNHTQRRALFIIDGDLSWVTGEPTPQVIGLHCHDAYCVENLILCKKALTLILSQEIIIPEEEAMVRLGYDTWVNSIQTPLIELFSAFATAFDLASPKVKTVSQGVHCLCSKQPTGENKLDISKVTLAKADALKAAEIAVGNQICMERYERILNRVQTLSDPLNAISGKDFLIPLIEFHLRSFGCQIKRKSLRMRLVCAGDMTRFASLARALKQAAKGLHLT